MTNKFLMFIDEKACAKVEAELNKIDAARGEVSQCLCLGLENEKNQKKFTEAFEKMKKAHIELGILCELHLKHMCEPDEQPNLLEQRV